MRERQLWGLIEKGGVCAVAGFDTEPEGDGVMSYSERVISGTSVEHLLSTVTYCMDREQKRLGANNGA